MFIIQLIWTSCIKGAIGKVAQGQLILTIHNTYMLECIDIKVAYDITADYQGNKECEK